MGQRVRTNVVIIIIGSNRDERSRKIKGVTRNDRQKEKKSENIRNELDSNDGINESFASDGMGMF